MTAPTGASPTSSPKPAAAPAEAGPQAGRAAVLVFTHVITPRIAQLVARLEAAFADRGDVFVVGYFKDKAQAPDRFRAPGGLAYDRADVTDFDYPRKAQGPDWRLMPGNIDLVLFRFQRDHPGYAHYWSIEGDVEFTGDLGALFATLGREDADLICTDSRPMLRGWEHRERCVIPEGWPAEAARAPVVFLPFFRASAQLLDALDAFHRAGGAGHHEWTWSYVARSRGLKILDIGGAGPFTPPEYRDRFYLAAAPLRAGTFRYRPAMAAPGARPDTLWHPVKDWHAPSGSPLHHPRVYPLRYVVQDFAPGLWRRWVRWRARG